MRFSNKQPAQSSENVRHEFFDRPTRVMLKTGLGGTGGAPTTGVKGLESIKSSLGDREEAVAARRGVMGLFEETLA